MIRHLITLIWNQRKQNGWIFAELALVLLAVFMITDGGYSKYTLYNEPLGYNIDRCWRLHLEEMESDNEVIQARTSVEPNVGNVSRN